jgi:hypothetical protein
VDPETRNEKLAALYKSSFLEKLTENGKQGLKSSKLWDRHFFKLLRLTLSANTIDGEIDCSPATASRTAILNERDLRLRFEKGTARRNPKAF